MAYGARNRRSAQAVPGPTHGVRSQGRGVIGRRWVAPLASAGLRLGILAASPGFVTPVGAAGSTPQTISFGALVGHVYGDAPFSVAATASSGLAVTFSVVNSSGVGGSSGTNGSTIDIEGAGTCTVRADQAGDSTYAAASSVDQSFSVTAAVTSVSVSNLPGSGAALVGGSFTPSFSYAGHGS